MAKESAAVFVHGLFSSKAVWDPLVGLLKVDSEISHTYDLQRFGYESPHWNWRLTRRIPDFNTIADSLATFFEVECGEYERIVLISHSQGGLIVQRFLARMLAQSRGIELGRIHRIVLLACPNSGSELLLVTRKMVAFWRHPQERELRPINDLVIEAQRRVLNSVVFADTAGPDRCPIPFAVYAGESDNVVTPSSAGSVFPRVGALPGDHSSILRADSTEHRTFTTLKANLLFALSEPSAIARTTSLPDPPKIRPELPPDRTMWRPVMKVTTTTTGGTGTRSQEIEIFDLQAADFWIHAHGTVRATEPEADDAD